MAELILLATAVYQANIRLGNLTSTALKLDSPYIMELYQPISSPVVGAVAIRLLLFFFGTGLKNSRHLKDCGWHNRGFWLCTLYSEHWPCHLLWLVTRCCIAREHNSEGTSPVSRPVAVCLLVLSLKLLNVFQPHLAHQHITSLNRRP